MRVFQDGNFVFAHTEYNSREEAAEPLVGGRGGREQEANGCAELHVAAAGAGPKADVSSSIRLGAPFTSDLSSQRRRPSPVGGQKSHPAFR